MIATLDHSLFQEQIIKFIYQQLFLILSYYQLLQAILLAFLSLYPYFFKESTHLLNYVSRSKKCQYQRGKIYLIINHIMSVFSALIIAFILCLPSLGLDCKASHVDFTGPLAVGRQEELIYAFQRIQNIITILPNVTYRVNETALYTIFNAKPTFNYRETKNQARILGNDTIVKFGGPVQVCLEFQWKRAGSIVSSGSSVACGISYIINYAKGAKIVDGSLLKFQYLDSLDVHWEEGAFEIHSDKMQNMTIDDIIALSKLLDTIPGVQTITTILEDEIDMYFKYLISMYIQSEQMPESDHFEYKWVPGNGKPNATIKFNAKPTQFQLNRQGIFVDSDVRITNYPGWKCPDRSPSNFPLNPKYYGSKQQIFFIDFYENIIRYAISNDLLDSALTRENWETQKFHFQAKDLFEILDNMKDHFDGSEPVIGRCRADLAGLTLKGSKEDSLNISIKFHCDLNIDRTTLVDFVVILESEVQMIPLEASMDFKLRRHESIVGMYPAAGFPIIEEQLGLATIKDAVNRLYENKLFGSGWPLSTPRQNPRIFADESMLVIYDATDVFPRLTEI